MIKLILALLTIAVILLYLNIHLLLWWVQNLNYRLQMLGG